MYPRTKAASSLLSVARAARVVVPCSTSFAALPLRRILAPVCTDREYERKATSNHHVRFVCAATGSNFSAAPAKPDICNAPVSINVHSGNCVVPVQRIGQPWAQSGPLTAAWHASHAATIDAQQQHASHVNRVGGLHTTAAAPAVAERVDTARYVDPVMHTMASRSPKSSEERSETRLQDIQEVAAVYDEMRDALRQEMSTDGESEFRGAMEPRFLETCGGRLAYHSVEASKSAAQTPGVIFCGGLMSNMNGKKATLLEVHARQQGHPFVRFDYRGHGASDGNFEDTVLGDWYEDTLEIIDHVAQPGCQHVLVGSSIGAWIALKAAASRRESIQGVVLLAPAVDITEVWWDAMSPDQRANANQSGFVPLQNSTPAGARVRVGFFDEASDHCILDVAQRDQQVRCPVRIFHGTNDDVVPPFIAGEIASWLESKDVKVSLVEGGDHRLSRPQDLRSLMLAVEELLKHGK